jgi:hypothetical protein
MDLKERGYGVVEWTEPASDEVWWRAPVDSTVAFYKLRKMS